MAKNKEARVYRIVDVVGVSTISWEDAAKRAVETAAQSIRDLRIAEVTKMDVTVQDGKVSSFRTKKSRCLSSTRSKPLKLTCGGERNT